MFKDRLVYNSYMRTKLSQRRAEFRSLAAEIKQQRGCLACGESDPRCLDFHHRNPGEKEEKLANVIGRATWKWGRVLAEIEKCDVLCSNCHRKLHAAA